MSKLRDVFQVPIRFATTQSWEDFGASHAFEWFEQGRLQILHKRLRLKPAALSAGGIRLPMTEAHVEFQRKALNTDVLDVITTVHWSRRPTIWFGVQIKRHGTCRTVLTGYAIHAITDPDGHLVRPPDWLLKAFHKAARQ